MSTAGRGQARGDGKRSAARGKNAQTDGVRPDKKGVQMTVSEASDDGRRDGGQSKRDPDVFRVACPVHRAVVDDHVAHDPPAESGDKRHDEYPDRIDILVLSGEDARQGESDNADGIGQNQKFGLHA